MQKLKYNIVLINVKKVEYLCGAYKKKRVEKH